MAENVIIPDEMDFETPPVLPVSRTYQRTFTPEGGSVYKEFQTIEFKIPPSPACYLGKTTYLSFDVHAKYVPGAGKKGSQTSYGSYGATGGFIPELNTAVLAFEKCGALGCIDRIQVYDYSGVNLLEDTSGHGQLMCLLRDLNTNLFESQYANSFTGTSQVYTGKQYGTTLSSVNNNDYFRGFTVQEGNTGDLFLRPQTILEHPRANKTDPPTYGIPYCTEVYSVKTVVVPVFSFLGVLSDQMVPLHNGFTVKFVLNSNLNAYTFSNPTGSVQPIYMKNVDGASDNIEFTIPTDPVSASITSIDYRHCQLVCDFYQLSPTAEQLLRSSRLSDEMIVHTKSYRNSNFFLNPNATEFSLTLNGNMKSVRNLIWFTRTMFNKTVPVGSLLSNNLQDNKYKWVCPINANIDISIDKDVVRAPTSYPRLSNRTRGNINKWWLKIDHEIIPSDKFIECGPNTEDVIRYTPNYYYLTSGPSTSASSLDVTVDRSCQSLYHLFNTQDKKNSMMHSIITRDNYTVDRSTVVGYPYEEVNWLGLSYADNTNWLQYNTESLVSLVNPYQNGVQGIGKFACGLNLQSRPYSSVNTMSGTDFSGKVARLEGQIKRDEANSTTLPPSTLDVYLEHDAFIHIIPGVLTTVAF